MFVYDEDDHVLVTTEQPLSTNKHSGGEVVIW